jgi:6-phosphofructokinase 1
MDDDEPRSACIGQQRGKIVFTDLEDIHRLMDRRYRRPREQWWLELRPVARVLAQPGPNHENDEQENQGESGSRV